MPFPAEVAFFVLYIYFINLLFIFLFVAIFFLNKKENCSNIYKTHLISAWIFTDEDLSNNEAF